ncbi:putative glutathione S-transferase, partial [Mucuna pruriens]
MPLLDAAWIAMCSRGDEQENAVKVAIEAMEKIEEEIKGKKYFGGENIGYLDIALGWISYWIPVWEEVGSMQIIDPLKFPGTTAWMTNFLIAERHFLQLLRAGSMMMGSDEVKVVSFWVTPYGRRVEWALKVKGVEYHYIEEDLLNKTGLLLELNPVHKKVPVLVHAHNTIAESLIILEYIDETWKHFPLLPQHPYQRAHARFLADFGDQKLLDAAWVATCSSGDKQENAVKVAREAMEKIEEEIKGKKFFGGENIGYLDIALGWISYWLPIWEEVGSMQIIDPLKCSATTAWMTNFLSHPVIKDSLPPRDKTLGYFNRRRCYELDRQA